MPRLMDRPNANITVEADLIGRARSNDRVARQELYVRTVDRIFRLLWRMTGNEADAGDLVQETYLRAFGRLSQFDGRSAFSTWLYRLAVNEALQFLKRSRRSLDRIGRPDLAETGADTTAERDVAMDIGEALSQLEPLDRAVLLLRYQEGLDYRAIADAMECTMGTVASRLNRARGRMLRLLNQGYGAGEEFSSADHLRDVEKDDPMRQGPRVEAADK